MKGQGSEDHLIIIVESYEMAIILVVLNLSEIVKLNFIPGSVCYKPHKMNSFVYS